METMRREVAEEAIEMLVRKAVPGQRGPGKIKGIQPRHIHKVIKSRAMQRTIGQERGVKVWGWLAKAAEEERIELKLTTEWTNEWINEQEHGVNRLRADAAWAEDRGQKRRLNGLADREEATGAIRTWMLLNEEPGMEGCQMLRTEKREALRTARSNLFKRLGGADAMHAALALLTAQGTIVTEQDRGAGGRRDAKRDWIEESVRWAEERNWLRDQEDPQEVTMKAREEQRKVREAWKPREGEGEKKILDVGEGWGSIGIAVSEIQGCATIGLDRAGFLEQGTKHGQITSRIKMDLATTGKENVLRRAAKLASRKLESFAMVWLSPECRILTGANAMNVTRGCANGRWAEDVRSMMPTSRLENSRAELEQCKIAITNQLNALLEEAEMKFAMENPEKSHLWDLVRENPGAVEKLTSGRWRMVTVHQCAYGRKCKKPTTILTNIGEWKPVGATGNGRCVPLKCGGTKNNKPGPGQGRHEQQMIATDPRRKPRVGVATEGNLRREYSVKAGKNMVQADLVREIVRAALEGVGK